MQKKQIKFIIILLAMVAVVSGCTPKLQSNQVVVESEVEQQNNQSQISTTTKERMYDVSKWETFVDEKLGISVKYPKDICRINGSPSGYSSGVICDTNSLNYQQVNDANPNIKNFSIKKIAQLVYEANLKDEINITQDRYISEISEVKINDKDAYQFIIEKKYCSHLDENFKCTGGGAVEGKMKMMFIEENNNKFQFFIFIRNNEKLSKLLLENLHFIKK